MDNKTEDLRVRRTHKLLHNALLETMQKQSFENISVKQLCDSAMVHRTTFYTHFNDKYDLLSHAIRHIAEDELNFIHAPLSPSESIKKVFSVATKHQKLFSQLLSEESDSLRALLRKEMGEVLHKHLVNNNSVVDNTIEIQIIIEAHIGAVLGVLSWWIENDMPIKQDEMYDKIEYLHKNGFFEMNSM